MQRRYLVNTMLSGLVLLGFAVTSSTEAGEPLRVTPAVRTVTSDQPAATVQTVGWRHGFRRGFYRGGFYGRGWGGRGFYGRRRFIGGWGLGYAYRPYAFYPRPYAVGYRPLGFGTYYSANYYYPQSYAAYSYYRPYPVATYAAPVYGAYYGVPYSGGAYYSASSYAVPYTVGYAPAISYSYRPYWGGPVYYGPSSFYYGGFYRRGWYW